MTPDLIARCTSSSQVLAARYADALTGAMTDFEIDTLARQAAFLAQVGHESGGLQWMHEIWGPNDVQERYEPPSDLATRLGNTQQGDGFRYRGRGPIQITGRYNYRVLGPIIGLDLEAHPEMLDDITNACRSAGAFWKLKACNTFVDLNDFIGLTKRINGGLNGLDDRRARWVRAKLALGVT